MELIDKSIIKKIALNLEERLNRKLNAVEREVFGLERSFLAYDMIFDYVSDEEKTKSEIEQYVKNVVVEYKTNLNNR